MRHLIIAKDKYCNIYKELISGTYEKISLFTSKFENSDDIRKRFKNIVKSFNEQYDDKGDIVIIDDNKENVRFKVLYKNDIDVAKVILQSQNFTKFLVKSKRLNNFSEWNIHSIYSLKKDQYKQHIRTWLNSRKNNDYYETIRIIIKIYDEYKKMVPDIPSRREIANAIKKKKDEANTLRSQTKQELKELYATNLDYTTESNSEFFDQIYDLYLNGGIEEVLNLYSIDDLYLKLNTPELIKIGINTYHR